MNRVYVPEYITVHLGSPSSSGANVRVSFSDYIKNVASSEIYPTWDEDALIANILAQTSFALNRVYTEYYRSRGYYFQITSSTAIDQAFVNGRNIFENISRLVDRLFNDYLRLDGFYEPLAAKFCNGTTVTCDGLSQWGAENLAQQGYDYESILNTYYGERIQIVYNAPVRQLRHSYPGYPLKAGSSGQNVTDMQTALNQIGKHYPAIPKIAPVDGVYGEKTTAAVRKFQSIFNLTADGIIGKETWYQIVKLYVGILRLSELDSLGQRYAGASWAYPDAIREGNRGEKVSLLQYMLALISEFDPAIPPVDVSGTFDAATKEAVLAYQRANDLLQDGVVGAVTWDAIYDTYAGYAAAADQEGEDFPLLRRSGPQGGPHPGIDLRVGMRDH